MKAALIVNADDFGLTEGTNRAIMDAHHSGIVTSTSLLANGYAFDHAVRQARDCPSLGVGVHLTLTEGPPVAADVGQLLAANGELPLSNQPVVHALILGRLPGDAIRREFTAQVEKVLMAGITPTHLDGHKYIHLLPGVASIAFEVAAQFAIPVVRGTHHPADPLVLWRPKRLPGLMILAVMGRLAQRVACQAGLKMVDRFIGFVDTGHLTPQTVQRLLSRPQPGFTELLCHPAYRSPELGQLLARGYAWIGTYRFEAETAAVSSFAVRQALEQAGWTLCHFGALNG